MTRNWSVEIVNNTFLQQEIDNDDDGDQSVNHGSNSINDAESNISITNKHQRSNCCIAAFNGCIRIVGVTNHAM